MAGWRLVSASVERRRRYNTYSVLKGTLLIVKVELKVVLPDWGRLGHRSEDRESQGEGGRHMHGE